MTSRSESPHDEDEGPCIICGKSVDDCICPECPDCGCQGDPTCYRLHRVKLTMPQVVAHQEFKIAKMKEAFADKMENEAIALSYLRDQKEVDARDFMAVIPPLPKKRR